jgi:hypothetical protein
MTIFGGATCSPLTSCNYLGASFLGDAWVLTAADGLGAPRAGGGTVTGFVTLYGGTPAPNALVEIFPTDTGSPFSRSARTDLSGNYTIAGVPSGRTFTVRAFNPNGTSSIDSTNNTVPAAGQSITVNLVLPPSATLHVTVLNASGTAISGAVISLQDSFRQFLRIVGLTDTNGILNITNVPQGSFTVQAQNPSTLAIIGTCNGTVTSTDQGQTINVTL